MKAIDVEERFLKGALRITIGEFNTKAQVDYLVENLIVAINKLRAI